MTDSFIPVGDTGKKLQTYLNTVGGEAVHSEAVTPTDENGVPLPITGHQINSVAGSTDYGVPFLGRLETSISSSSVADGDYDLISITHQREVRTRDQRAIDLCNCNDVSAVTILGNDTSNLANSVSHVFGTGALTFDKVNGAANTVFAGVQKTLTSIDIQEVFEAGGFVGIAAYIPSLTNIQNVFLRVGTNSTNYNCWTWDVSTLTAATWLNLRAATSSPDKDRSLGNGWNTNAITYVAFGCEFLLETNTLSGMIFDHVYMVGGRVTSTDINASISSSVSTPNVNILKVGNQTVDHGSGTVSSGTMRVTLPTDVALPAGTNSLGKTIPEGSASGVGTTPYSNTALSNTKQAVKASSGRLYGYHIHNPNTSTVYIQFFDVASGGVTVGSTTPTFVLTVPANSTSPATLDCQMAIPISFGTAITIAATTTATGSTAPSTALCAALFYL